MPCSVKTSLQVELQPKKDLIKTKLQDFPGGTVDKHLLDSAEDMSLIPGLGRFHMSLSN